MKRWLTILIITLCSFQLWATQPMGSWHSYQSFTYTNEVAEAQHKVYGLSQGALYSVDKRDQTIIKHSKINGLNDNNIAHIKYSDQNNLLIIAYKNANIDFLYDNGDILNFSDFYLNSASGDKNIYHIYIKDQLVYFSTGYGLSVIDLKKREVVDSYIIGPNGSNEKMIGSSILNDTIYALSENRLLKAPIKGTNLLDYSNWKLVQAPLNTITNQSLISYDNSLFVLKTNGQLMSYTNGKWNDSYSQDVKHISEDENHFFISYLDKMVMYFSGKQTEYARSWTSVGQFDSKTNCVWFNDTRGICKANSPDELSHYYVEGPIDNSPYRMRFSQNHLYVVPGGRWASGFHNLANMMVYDGNSWHNSSQSEIAALSTNPKGMPYVDDFCDIAVDPNDPKHFFVASYANGLFEFKDYKPFKIYNQDNSGILSVFENVDVTVKPHKYYYYQRVDALKFDSKGNLWFFNANPGGRIRYMDPSGIIHDGSHPTMPKFEAGYEISWDQNDENYQYILIHCYIGTTTTGFFVKHDPNTPNNILDDQTRFFDYFYDQDNKRFNPPNFLCNAQDKKGAIWIGTTTGIAIIENIKDVFQPNYQIKRIKIPRNDGTNLADYLLDKEEITSIIVDGANRKWIGTKKSGVFLVSEDGLETIHHFTTDNSPLFSNSITSMALNESTGELFIGTSIGIISYQSDAIEPNKTFSNIHAFPNPVREDFEGTISITGLVENSIVKITDINGNILYETISNGGIATWNGNTRNGERVSTGIYLAHCYTFDGEKQGVAKILIVNK